MRALALLAASMLFCGLGMAQRYSAESFAAELERLDAAIGQDAGAAMAGLPQQWEVATETRTYFIPTEPLTQRLGLKEIAGAREWLGQMRGQVESFGGNTSSGDGRGRAALKAILSRPEFADAPPPSAWELFWAGVRQWLSNWLDLIFQYAGQHPTGSQVLFWTLIVAAVVALGAWLVRLWSAEERMWAVPEPAPMEHKLQSWQEWMADARAAAAAGDQRQAVRCAYWAAVARLQVERTVRINFTHTPRERLRVLAQAAHRVEPLPEAQMRPLTAITHTFERCWYANLPANEEDVARCFESTEALGCRVN